MLRAVWRLYRNLLLVGTPTITLILSIPPLVEILFFGQATPFDDALQYLPPYTVVVAYLGATGGAVLLLMSVVAAALAIIAWGLWQYTEHGAVVALVYAALLGGGFSLLTGGVSSVSSVDVVTLILVVYVLSLIALHSRPARYEPALPNPPLQD